MNGHYLQDTLYVVLDTNVLLSHLKLISELKDFPIEGRFAGCTCTNVCTVSSMFNTIMSIQILLLFQ